MSDEQLQKQLDEIEHQHAEGEGYVMPSEEPVKMYVTPRLQEITDPSGKLIREVPGVFRVVPLDDYDRDIKALRELLLESKRSHFWVDEDCFYSCPKAPDYCGNEETDECTCGAEDWNAKVDAALKSTE